MSVAERFKAFPLLIAAVTVAAGYYVGVQIGLTLTFPLVTTSVLWPPNAILTTALLLVPVRHWWVCLAAALPVHFTLELGAGMPPDSSGCCSSPIAVRRLSPPAGCGCSATRQRNSTHSAASSCFCSALCWPRRFSRRLPTPPWCISSRVSRYWTVFRTRVFGNALTELSIVPCVVGGLLAIVHGVRTPRALRVVEAVALTLCLVAMAVWVFGGGVQILPITRTPPMLLLPLFWAAARFGVGGVSAALFLSAFLASYETRLNPAAIELSPLEGLMAVQVYLIVIGLPLMCMAALLDERRRGALDLADRLKFEALLSTISRDLVRTPSGLGPADLDGCLRRVGEFLEVDCVCVQQIGEGSGDLPLTRQWRRSAAQALASTDCVQRFPWAFSRAFAGEGLVCNSIDGFPVEAVKDRQVFQSHGIQSVVLLPLEAGGRILGGMSVVTLRPRTWADRELTQLGIVAEVLSNAAARQHAEVEVQRTRQQIAHLARLSSMGELTASLAHQLGQPLTGILNNAEGARRFIDSGRATIP